MSVPVPERTNSYYFKIGLNVRSGGIFWGITISGGTQHGIRGYFSKHYTTCRFP